MYSRHVLENGIKVIMEKIPHYRSISMGAWFKVGSAYENADNNGIAHFIEHRLFKGTNNRSAKQIAEAMDAVGGQLNAFTAKEYTCFYCKVMDEHLDIGIDLLSDMILNSTFDKTEFEKEKGIILEEIYMYDDSPEDLVYENLCTVFFKNHPLSLPILGTEERIINYNEQNLIDFYNSYFTPENMVISIAGNYDEDLIIDKLNKYFGDWNNKGHTSPINKIVDYGMDISYEHKDIEQVHLCLGAPGIDLNHKDLYPLFIFNNIIGGSMSSRLFQKIREDNGLVYSIYSYPSNYLSGGMFSIYTSLKPDNLSKVMDLILNEIDDVLTRGIATDEFRIAKEQLKGNYILGLESTNNRMSAMGKSELLLNKVMLPDEVLQLIENVTIDHVQNIIKNILENRKYAISLVGPEDMRTQLMRCMEM